MFALLAEQPQYNDIVKPFIALAPVTSVGFSSAPVRLLATNIPLIEFFRWKGGPLLPDKLISYVSEKFCSTLPIVTQPICSNLLFFILGGWDSPQLNSTRLPVYVSQDPAGTSAKNMIHWAQSINSGRFAKFDYGLFENLAKYTDVIPPSYDLGRITNKNIVLMSSTNDAFADPLDVAILRSKLNVKPLKDYLVPDPLFNHLDFIWALDAGGLVNKVVIDVLDEME